MSKTTPPGYTVQERTSRCTRAERLMLDMIACWPGVPALVTVRADGGFSFSTPDAESGFTPLTREDMGLGPETRTARELQAAEEEERLCDIASTNLRLNDGGLAHLGKGGKPLDAIFDALSDAGMLHLSGAVLLSPESTLKPGPMLFMGLNPGGDEASAPSTILDNLAACRRELSAWNEDWNGRLGEAVLQRRFRQVASVIGLDPLTIPATNVVFTRSRNVASHTGWTEARASAARVHRILADTVHPDRLWFMGNPGLAGDLLTLEDVEWRPAGHGTWTIGHGTASYAGHKVRFCHTPHLSVWDPTGKEAELRFAFGLSD